MAYETNVQLLHIYKPRMFGTVLFIKHSVIFCFICLSFIKIFQSKDRERVFDQMMEASAEDATETATQVAVKGEAAIKQE